jgi:aspartokinase
MKFGGTSVADASCISKVVEIIRSAARESNVVVVVSAMSGVTNRLPRFSRNCASGTAKPSMR